MKIASSPQNGDPLQCHSNTFGDWTGGVVAVSAAVAAVLYLGRWPGMASGPPTGSPGR